jgi:Tripartite tricarboxylate transporter TctB family
MPPTEVRMTPANELMNNKRFLSGLMFLGIGGVAIYMAQDYPMGSALRMGPGYFPIVLGGLMGLFGIYELILGIMKSDPVKGNWSVRALIVLPLAAVVFGIMMEKLGFVIALVALIFVSAAASREFKFLEVLISAVVITLASVGVFIYGLGLPYPLFSGH